MIELLPEGGLCNRMRSIASTLLLARSASVPLRVRWLMSPDFNAAPSALFDLARIPCRFDVVSAPGKAAKLRERVRERWLRLRGVRVWGPAETGASAFAPLEIVAAARGGAVFVRTNSRLVKERDMYAVFCPAPGLQRAIDAYRTQGGASLVGVHIRRTDNVKAMASGPLASFERAMDSARERWPATKFFLATDSLPVFEHFRSRYGEQVFQHKKRSYSRNDAHAIEDAVIDLYTLAQCNYLIGSHWSSFTDTAWELRDIDHEIVNDQGEGAAA